MQTGELQLSGEAHVETVRTPRRRTASFDPDRGTRLQPSRSTEYHPLPDLDGTDLYMFMSYESGRDGYVTLIADYYPFQDPFAGPNYFALDKSAFYEINIDNDGDGQPDITYYFHPDNQLAGASNQGIKLPVGGQQVAIPLKNAGALGAGNTAALNFIETYKMRVKYRTGPSTGDSAVSNAADGSTTFTKPVDFIGVKTFGSVDGYAAYANQYVYNVNIPGCSKPGRVFVGQRKEPFQIAVGKIFDLVNLVPIDASAFPGGLTQNPKTNTLAEKNITTFAVEVHASCLTGAGNGVIGGWTTARLPQARVLSPHPTFNLPEVAGGALTQVSRLGMPLVNEVVIGLPDKDRFNGSAPAGDASFLNYVTNPTLPALLDVLFRDPVNQTLGTHLANLAPSNIPRTDLVATFLTGIKTLNQQKAVTPSEMMRLNTMIAAVAPAQQSALGALGGDLSGFPNGRRPGDDVTDIELRVAMGALCYPLTVGGKQVDLGLCHASDAPVGNVPFTDGVPTSAADFDTSFPYLKTPLPGSSNYPGLAYQ